MAIHRINVLVTTARGQQNAKGGTPATTLPYLQRVPGYLREIPQTQQKRLPLSALGADYELRVAPGTDIRTGDHLIAVVSAEDGVTPWPDFLAIEDQDHAASAAQVIWTVKWSRERPPQPDNFRPVYLLRQRVGGPDFG